LFLAGRLYVQPYGGGFSAGLFAAVLGWSVVVVVLTLIAFPELCDWRHRRVSPPWPVIKSVNTAILPNQLSAVMTHCAVSTRNAGNCTTV